MSEPTTEAGKHVYAMLNDEVDHQDDSYGSCTICREYVPHTDDEMRTVAWPCAVVREARLRRIEEAARALSDSVQTVEITDGEYVRLNSTGPQEVWHLFCAALEEGK